MIYDFRILPFALGDIVISMIHGSIDLKGKTSKFPFYYYRNDLEKSHPIQLLINKRNTKRYLGDLNEALLFNPLGLRVKKLTKKSENTGCETTQDLEIQSFYKDYVESDRVKQYHNYFNLNIASHKFLNKLSDENNQIPRLQSPSVLTRVTRSIIKRYTGKNKWICVHLRFRGLNPKEDLADLKRNADPGYWHALLSEIAQEYKNDHAVLLLGPAGGYPASFYEIPNLYAISGMGGTLKNSIAAILSATVFIGSSSGFANCATFSNTPYLIFDVGDEGYENYCINKNSARLPFAKKQQYLSSQSERTQNLRTKIRLLLPRLKKRRLRRVNKAEVEEAKIHFKKNRAFSHTISKLISKLETKPDVHLFSEICLLEKTIPNLKEDPILKMLKDNALFGMGYSRNKFNEYLKKIKELESNYVNQSLKHLLKAQNIEVLKINSICDCNWSSFSRDLDIRSLRNLLQKIYSLGHKTVHKRILIILLFLWKYWYRAFYKPFSRYRF